MTVFVLLNWQKTTELLGQGLVIDNARADIPLYFTWRQILGIDDRSAPSDIIESCSKNISTSLHTHSYLLHTDRKGKILDILSTPKQCHRSLKGS